MLTPRPSASCPGMLCVVALAVASIVTAAPGFAPRASAGCNLIPGTAKTFNGAVGATNRPYAAPGETVEIVMRRCDTGSQALTANPADHVVTVIFTPPDGAARHAVVLTAAPNCSAINPQLGACNAALGGGTATCLAGTTAGLFVADRNDGRHLGFRFPNTDALLSPPDDRHTLAGPATIAVTAPGTPLPCHLASASCTNAPGLIACIDDLFANDGSCGTGVPNDTFPHFTALPLPNDYQTSCFDESPPCSGGGEEVRAALDGAGNLLMPINWGGVNLQAGGTPVARLLRAAIRSPEPVRLPDRVFVGSFTP